ncbi:hypothetical protein ABZN20_15905 [Methylococcus sp. ANG]|uniref:hypothetical protein n=1 Tax=Methylococcus sp. ANG TaxID=3231903 RepID=UPI003457DDA9
MKGALSIAAFLLSFLLVQKILPVLIPLSEFSGAGRVDLLQWLFGFRSLATIALIACFILFICGWPLTRLSVFLSLVFGIVAALLCGFTIFPYNVFDLEIVSRQYFDLSVALWVIVLLFPWGVAMVKKL